MSYKLTEPGYWLLKNRIKRAIGELIKGNIKAAWQQLINKYPLVYGRMRKGSTIVSCGIDTTTIKGKK